MCGGGLGQLGLLVSMVISLCVFVGDNGAQELKVIVEGVSAWFGGVDEE